MFTLHGLHRPAALHGALDYPACSWQTCTVATNCLQIDSKSEGKSIYCYYYNDDSKKGVDEVRVERTRE